MPNLDSSGGGKKIVAMQDTLNSMTNNNMFAVQELADYGRAEMFPATSARCRLFDTCCQVDLNKLNIHFTSLTHVTASTRGCSP